MTHWGGGAVAPKTNKQNVFLLLGAFQLGIVCFSSEAFATESVYIHLQHVRNCELHTTVDKLDEAHRSVYCLGVRGGTYGVRLSSVLTH